jgi:hypothetical protein
MIVVLQATYLMLFPAGPIFTFLPGYSFSRYLDKYSLPNPVLHPVSVLTACCAGRSPQLQMAKNFQASRLTRPTLHDTHFPACATRCLPASSGPPGPRAHVPKTQVEIFLRRCNRATHPGLGDDACFNLNTIASEGSCAVFLPRTTHFVAMTVDIAHRFDFGDAEGCPTGQIRMLVENP